MTKTPWVLTLRLRMSPRWEWIWGQGFPFVCVFMKHLPGGSFPFPIFVASVRPIARSLPSLSHCLSESTSYLFGACQISHLSFTLFSLLHTNLASPVTPTVKPTDSVRTLPTPLPLRHLGQCPQFCTIDPRPTYLTAESRNPEPHSRS